MTVKSTHKVNAFSSEPQALSEGYTRTPLLSLESLAASFLQLADRRLTGTQKLLLKWSADVLRFRNLTMTALADAISRHTHVPYSTVKWNLRALVDLGLMVGGKNGDRGKHACLTAAGAMLADYLHDTI